MIGMSSAAENGSSGGMWRLCSSQWRTAGLKQVRVMVEERDGFGARLRGRVGGRSG